MSSAITRAYRLARLPAGLLVICVLAACSSTDSAADGASTVMTQAAQLALGTIDLEGTDQAVDGGSASKQLPLWQLLADMSSSTTAAPFGPVAGHSCGCCLRSRYESVFAEVRRRIASGCIDSIQKRSNFHRGLALQAARFARWSHST